VSAAGASEADRLIAQLGLEPHPEGGWYRETWRHAAPDGGRGAGTAIYFLLRAGETSAWHRVDAAEVWHYYAGAPLELDVVEDGRPRRECLGPDVAADQRPQRVVPAGAWQRARSLGDFTLVGCTVSPAFEFAGFELAPDGFDPVGS
jgi:predicted cupin superfamily sugar epimerase